MDAELANDLVITNGSGKLANYAGSNCSAGNAPTGISAAGAVQNCTAYQASGTYLTSLGNYATTTGTAISFSTSTLSFDGVTWGMAISMTSNAVLFTPTASGNFNSLSHDSTLNGTTYNLSAAVSNWGLNLANSNWWTATQNFTNASTSQFTATSTVYLTGLTASSLLAIDNNNRVIASSTIGWNLLKGPASSIFAFDSSGNPTATTSIGVNYLTGVLPIANGGTNATSCGTTNALWYYDGTRFVCAANFTYNGATGQLATVTNASTTNLTVGTSLLTATSNALVGIASSSPSVLWGMTIATTTIVQNAGFALSYASSTIQTPTFTVNWDNGDNWRVIASTTINIVINSTSSNPRDGGHYVLKICQDATGGRTVNFITPGQLDWANGTTSVSTTLKTATLIGMVYDAHGNGGNGIYDVVASSTITDTRSCF